MMSKVHITVTCSRTLTETTEIAKDNFDALDTKLEGSENLPSASLAGIMLLFQPCQLGNS